MTLESAIHRAVEEAGHGLRAAAGQAAVDEVTAVLDDVDQAAHRLELLGKSWASAPETVRNLLDIAPAEAVQVAARTERTRTDTHAEAETVASLLYHARADGRGPVAAPARLLRRAAGHGLPGDGDARRPAAPRSTR